MTHNATASVLFGAIVLAVALGGCVSGKSGADTYTSRSGSVTTIENDREACVRACNDEYSRCGDSASAQRNVGPEPAPGLFGVKADCRETLKKCLPRCKGR